MDRGESASQRVPLDVINTIMAACAPYWWDSNPAPPEPHLAIGCIHPLESVFINSHALPPIAQCALCKHVLGPEEFQVRWDDYQRLHPKP